MYLIDLTGPWRLSQANQKKTITAQVPGCVHTDLLAAGKIDDPYYRDNENRLKWIGDTGWKYFRKFDVPAELLSCDSVLLSCEGLDTLATIRVNGKRVAKTNNMFRTWEFDVKRQLKSGTNSIEIQFESATSYVDKQQKKDPIPTWLVPLVQYHHAQWIRKEPCNFGWDWGPRLTTCGIWRDINIVAFDTARLSGIQIDQDHSKRSSVGLEISASAEVVEKAKLQAAVTVYLKSRKIAQVQVPFKDRNAKARIEIKNPKLWWPNGMAINRFTMSPLIFWMATAACLIPIQNGSAYAHLN